MVKQVASLSFQLAVMMVSRMAPKWGWIVVALALLLVPMARHAATQQIVRADTVSARMHWLSACVFPVLMASEMDPRPMWTAVGAVNSFVVLVMGVVQRRIVSVRAAMMSAMIFWARAGPATTDN